MFKRKKKATKAYASDVCPFLYVMPLDINRKKKLSENILQYVHDTAVMCTFLQEISSSK